MQEVRAVYQAMVAAPGFCVAIRCDDRAIESLEYLAPCSAQVAGNALATEAARQVRAYLECPGFVFDLPLRPCGSVFQRRVWAQIAAIPLRQTQTYGQLAERLGTAPRAVGQACGANPFPLLVPCHRVLAAQGRLGGFARQRGGFLLEVKRWLLAHENA